MENFELTGRNIAAKSFPGAYLVGGDEIERRAFIRTYRSLAQGRPSLYGLTTENTLTVIWLTAFVEGDY